VSIYQLKNGRWRVQIRRKGFPHYESVFASKGEAEAAQAEALRERQALTYAGDTTLQAAWERYRASRDFDDKSANTQRTELGRITPILDSLGSYSLGNLEKNPGVIHDYIDQRSKYISPRTKKRLSKTSLRLEIAVLSSIVSWAINRRMIGSDFMKLIRRPSVSKRKRRVPPIEQGKLQMAIYAFDNPPLAEAARFALLLRYLGCRPGELASLLRRDVNLQKQEITFRDTKFKGEDRLIHVTQNAVEFLDAQLGHATDSAPDAAFVFSTRGRATLGNKKAPWKPYGYHTAVKRLREAGVVGTDFHAHAMRREFISRAIESGLEYAIIRKQTGHHSTQAIEIYDEGLSTAPEVREALEKHEKIIEHDKLIGSLQSSLSLSDEQIEDLRALLKNKPKHPIKRVFRTGSDE